VSRLELATSRSGSAVVIALQGELDMAGAITLEAELERLDSDALVLDLRGLTFMDSSGLRVLVVNSQRAQDRGRRFALVPGAAQVMRVFEITRMRERLEFVPDPAHVTGAP
jgi:anti-sigma B factor antagonist/stage II sporulation protein AA (anti-sigma F factor antagonist)